jgi:phosphatidylserine/phosphatidylglycerophosphate/cardiolipin synthase-like enzyme
MDKESREKQGFYVTKIIEKYPYDLNSISGCQRVLVKMLKENKGDILINRPYYIIDKRCQDLIIEAESRGFPYAEKYRKRQNRIERIADNLNNPNLPLGNYSKINIILKARTYRPKVYRVGKKNESK